MKRSLSCVLIMLLFTCAALAQISQAPESCKSTVVGTLDINPLTSKIFGNTRNLQAMLRHTEEMLVIDDKAKHNEAAWARRFPVAIGFLFGGKEQKLLSRKQ